jgi:four helix bundle protein
MTHQELCARTARFARQAIETVRPILSDPALKHAGSQLIRSSAAMAANYRSTGESRSRPDFVSKLSIALEEADESIFWIELIAASAGTIERSTLSALHREAKELAAILGASRRTVLTNRAPIRPPLNDGPNVRSRSRRRESAHAVTPTDDDI